MRYRDLVIFIAGGALAFDETGELRWRSLRFDGSDASPILAPRRDGPVPVPARWWAWIRGSATPGNAGATEAERASECFSCVFIISGL